MDGCKEGYICLHRKILDNPVCFKDPDHLAVWLYLLLSATQKEAKANFSGKEITLNPGQLVTGRLSIAKATGVSDSKVYRILSRLKSEQQIEQQTGSKNSVITILNWSKYQKCEQQNDGKVNTNNNNININNINIKSNKSNKHIFTPPTLEEVIAYCRDRNNHVDPVKFMSYYESNGWMVGKNKMKDWRAAVRTWERSEKNGTGYQKNAAGGQGKTYKNYGLTF